MIDSNPNIELVRRPSVHPLVVTQSLMVRITLEATERRRSQPRRLGREGRQRGTPTMLPLTFQCNAATSIYPASLWWCSDQYVYPLIYTHKFDPLMTAITNIPRTEHDIIFVMCEVRKSCTVSYLDKQGIGHQEVTRMYTPLH